MVKNILIVAYLIMILNAIHRIYDINFNNYEPSPLTITLWLIVLVILCTHAYLRVLLDKESTK